MQTESTPASGNNSMMKTIVMVVLVLALLGVGYWGFTKNSKLTVTSGELAAARIEIDGLKTANATLSSSLEETTASLVSTTTELEKTTGELSTASANLTKTTDEKSALQAKVTKANKLVDVLLGLSDDSVSLSEYNTMIRATSDAELLRLWNAFVASNTVDNLNAYVNYLHQAIRDSLK